MKKEVFDSIDKQFVLSVIPEAKMRIVKNKNVSLRYEIYNCRNILAVSFVNEKTAWIWAKKVVNNQLINKLNK